MNNGWSVKTAVIGVGNIGSVHAAQIYAGAIPGLALCALCDIDPHRRAVLASQYPDVPIFADADTLLAESDAEAVVIATPHRFHAEIAIKAFWNRLHVLTEKPAAVELADALRMNAAARASGCVFGIMFNQRTDPLFLKARELISSGELGQLKRSSWVVTNWYRTQAYYDSGNWRATWNGEGGGVLLNQAPHNLDIWTWLLGMPEYVTAFCGEGKYHHIAVEDEATIYTEYSNGATGVFITSTGEAPGTNRLEMVFDRGRIVLENGRLELQKLAVSEREFCFSAKTGFALPDISREVFEAVPVEDGHTVILKNFAAAINEEVPLIAPGVEGIKELSISNAAYLSSWTGRRIALPMSPETCAEFSKLLGARRAAEAAAGDRPTGGSEGGNGNGVRRNGDAAGNAADTYKKRWQVRW